MQRASEDIDSYCGKCRLELAHVIVAAENGKAVRVQCKTCGSPHNHRPKKTSPSGRSATPRPGSRRSTTRTSTSDSSSFEQRMEGQDISRATRYRPQVVLAKDQVVDHPKFGFGLVVRLLSGDKASVLFRDAERTLVHGR